LVVLALGGCRTSEPLSGERTTNGEPGGAVAAASAGGADEGKDAAGGAVAGEGKVGAGEPDEGKAAGEGKGVGEGKAVVDEQAGAEPADGEPGDQAAAGAEPTPSDPAAPPSVEIQTFYASYPEEATGDARFTARKLPKRAEEIRGLLDVRPLLGQPVLASPKPTADVVATITPEGLVTPTDSCIWVTFQQELKWTKGRIRCGDVFLREPDTGEGHEEMVPVLETVTVKGTRWSRIIANNAGRTGWVKTESVPRKFTKVLARYAAGSSRTWDRMLYGEPGVSPVKIEFRGAIALKIEETRKVDGRTWIRVVARVDQCVEDSRRKLGEGWLPQHAEDGSLNVYYELSC
jgi:hypothetical protein